MNSTTATQQTHLRYHGSIHHAAAAEQKAPETSSSTATNANHRHQRRKFKRKLSSFAEDISSNCKNFSDPANTKLVLLIVCLIVTQMIMLIATKQVMNVSPLPLLLCQAQFMVSSASAALFLSLWKLCNNQPNLNLKDDNKSSVPATNMNLSLEKPWTFYVPLSICWTMGFVLFNASASYMSPSHVNLMRCGEPVATVILGTSFFQKRYSWRVLVTLIPVLGGVWLASPSSGELSIPGILLAGLSNVCFCIRPFVLHAMKQQKIRSIVPTTKPKRNNSSSKNVTSKQQEDLNTFLQVTTIAATGILPPLVWIMEGRLLQQYYGSLYSKLQGLFLIQIAASCLGFFSYQYTQLCVMSLTSPLAFSILTPVIKAVMIVLCSIYFGDVFCVRQAVGVLITTGGGYWFTQTSNSDGNNKTIRGATASGREMKQPSLTLPMGIHEG